MAAADWTYLPSAADMILAVREQYGPGNIEFRMSQATADATFTTPHLTSLMGYPVVIDERYEKLACVPKERE